MLAGYLIHSILESIEFNFHAVLQKLPVNRKVVSAVVLRSGPGYFKRHNRFKDVAGTVYLSRSGHVLAEKKKNCPLNRWTYV